MALTAAQRNRLPDSAFALRGRRYPMPTRAQARRAGISERQRLNLHRNALARSTNARTRGSYRTMAQVSRRRAPAVRSTSRRYGTVHRPGLRQGRRR